MSSDKRFCALGFFDGVHLGHAEIMRRAAVGAAANNMIPTVVTFDRRPGKVLNCDNQLLLSPGRAKRKLIDTLFPGTDVIEIPFTEDFASKAPEEFIESILKKKLNAAGAAAGEDFRFGRGASGDVAFLSEKMLLSVVGTVTLDGERVSSTGIRKLLAGGDFEGALKALGHPMLLGGTVEHGDGRGHRIGLATLNLKFDPEQLYPKNGVYASAAEVDGKFFPAVTNLGNRPTFYENGIFTNETHIIGKCPDLYGKTVWVWLCAYLRDERRFSSPEELAAQVAADSRKSVSIFENGGSLPTSEKRG